ncbi:MAG: LPS assembly protein LptD [Pseudomonadales bacterium]|nr:LPS assembly protein LptD [Pseudomonadales bacterium]
MFRCSYHIKAVVAVGLALLGFAGTSFFAEEVLAQEGDRPDPVICLPNSSGTGWDCREDDGVRPDTKSVAERSARARDAELSRKKEEQARRAAAEADAISIQGDTSIQGGTGDPESDGAGDKPAPATSMMGDDPAGWYQESKPRPADEQHRLKADLAASYFVTSESTGSDKCHGGYVVREYPHPLTAPNESFVVTADADGLSSIIDESVSLLGNVTIEQGNRLIYAGQTELDQETMIAAFPQGLVMDQPGMVMQGRSAKVDLSSDEADLEDVQFVLTDIGMRGGAQELNQNTDGDLLLHNNQFTRCEPGDNGWRLNTSSLLIEKDEVFGTARNAVLRMKSVPVFYTPYLKFPVTGDRVSGLLFPNLSYSDEDGVDISVPYYLNLAPNYDATVIPRYISKRGASVESEFRHMSSWQSSTFAASLLPKDNVYNGEVNRDDFDEAGGEAAFGPFDSADRWLGSVDHQGRVGPFRTIVDYTAVSDRDYFSDLGSDLGLSSRRELERRGEIRYSRGGLSTRLWAQGFQRIDEIQIDEYERLPELEVNWRRRLVGPLQFSIASTWADFDRDTERLNGLAAVTGSRLHLEPRVKVPFSWPFGFLSFGGGYRHTSYDLEQDRNAAGLQLLDSSPDRGIGLAHVDGGLFFERELNWFNTPLIQTLEPRVYFLWQDFEDQSRLPKFDSSLLTFNYSQLYRDNRFSGIDRIADTRQVSTGVTTRFVSANNGREFFRFSVGEIFYFLDRRVTLNDRTTANERQSTSAYAADMTASIAKSWRLYGNVVWDPNDNEVDEGGGGIQFRRDNRRIVNVGFRHNRVSNVEQTDFSMYWPLTDSFAILGRWNYDLESGRTIEGFGGIEYEDCCLQVRLMARRFLESRTDNFAEVEGDDGIFVQIVFKGLAGFGTKVESVLERGIRGYRSPVQGGYFSNYGSNRYQ